MNNAKQNRVGIWDLLSIVWGSLARITVIGSDMVETSLDAAADVSYIAKDTTHGYRRNRMITREEELDIVIKDNPDMAEKIKLMNERMDAQSQERFNF